MPATSKKTQDPFQVAESLDRRLSEMLGLSSRVHPSPRNTPEARVSGGSANLESSAPRPAIVKLVDFVPRLNRKFYRPAHLEALGAAFDRAIAGEPVRVLGTAPPRHGKTELILHAIVLYLLANPTKR